MEEHKSEASTEAHVEEDVSLMSAPVDVEETDTDAGDQLEVMDKRALKPSNGFVLMIF